MDCLFNIFRFLLRSVKLRRIDSGTSLAILGVVFLIILILLYLSVIASNRDDFLVPLPDQEMTGASQDNLDLIAYIRQLHIQSPTGGKYNLENPDVKDPSQNGQGMLIAKIFDHKRSGTFLEAGAYNGEEYSNTLYLERDLGWTGLLVEPDPWNFWALRKRSRKAHSVQCCISPFSYPREVSFKQSDTMGRIVDSSENKRRGIFTRVKCFPVYSLMLAQNLTTLDLLSLDIEGKELQVLQTIPWDKVYIRSIIIEFSHVPEGESYLKKYMKDQNYLLHSTIGEDFVFIKKGI